MTNIEKYKLWVSQENLSQEFIKQFADPSKSEIESLPARSMSNSRPMTAAVSARYPQLCSPIRLGPLELPHCAVTSGHGMLLAGHVATGAQIEVAASRARGGERQIARSR